MTFKEIGLDEKILEAVSYMGFENATPIQELAMPAILHGKDLIACAQTGTGKTAAFLLPLLNKHFPNGFSNSRLGTNPRRVTTNKVADISKPV